jgi:hypothetical protein
MKSENEINRLMNVNELKSLKIILCLRFEYKISSLNIVRLMINRKVKFSLTHLY